MDKGNSVVLMVKRIVLYSNRS